MKCKHKHCRNQAAPKRKECHSCRCNGFKKRCPERYAYNNLKHNAAKRGKDFDLTFEQFKAFCVRTQYMVGKGRYKDSLSIDRRENEYGYTIDNLQILTVSQNASKRNRKVLIYDWEHPDMATVRTLEPFIVREGFKRKSN